MANLTLGNISKQQHKAIARLHLKFTGDIHGLLHTYATQVKQKVREYTLADGLLNPIGALPLNNWIADSWKDTFNEFEDRFEAARRQAALISFGSLGIYHNGVFGWASEDDLTEAQPAARIEGVPFYEPQLQEVIDAANQRVYSDGFNISQRIWRLNESSLAGLKQIVLETVATGDSAWNAAHRLEEYLGAGQDCPRWTSTRLFKLTKSDIAAGDQRGLIKGPCSSKGVSYNALRLARNEIQIAHQMANDAILQRMPWVEMEQIKLSPSHPSIGCACEGVVTGGENGDGVYPLGTITLPVHVQCLCRKDAVLPDPDEFVGRLRGWVKGESTWPEMDEYANWVGGTKPTMKSVLGPTTEVYKQLTLPLFTWISGSETELDELLDN